MVENRPGSDIFQLAGRADSPVTTRVLTEFIRRATLAIHSGIFQRWICRRRRDRVANDQGIASGDRSRALATEYAKRRCDRDSRVVGEVAWLRSIVHRQDIEAQLVQRTIGNDRHIDSVTEHGRSWRDQDGYSRLPASLGVCRGSRIPVSTNARYSLTRVVISASPGRVKTRTSVGVTAHRKDLFGATQYDSHTVPEVFAMDETLGRQGVRSADASCQPLGEQPGAASVHGPECADRLVTGHQQLNIILIQTYQPGEKCKFVLIPVQVGLSVFYNGKSSLKAASCCSGTLSEIQVAAIPA